MSIQTIKGVNATITTDTDTYTKALNLVSELAEEEFSDKTVAVRSVLKEAYTIAVIKLLKSNITRIKYKNDGFKQVVKMAIADLKNK